MLLSTRKSPSESAILYPVGKIKKGNDGNKWIIVENKNQVKRWKKIQKKTNKSNKTNKTKDIIWGVNITLEKFWQELSTGKKYVIIYKTKPYKIQNIPKGKVAYSKYIEALDANPDVIAILTSSMSSDSYTEYLYPKAKNKTIDYVIKNYKKIFQFMDNKMYSI